MIAESSSLLDVGLDHGKGEVQLLRHGCSAGAALDVHRVVFVFVVYRCLSEVVVIGAEQWVPKACKGLCGTHVEKPGPPWI